MEFRFDIKPIFSNPIARITANMLPHTFRGDRKSALDCTQKVSEIINTVGENSAKAQGLTKAVTTAQKLRQSDHKIYLLADVDDGKNGSVIGMLKVGQKSLYVFDENGETKMVDTPCVLDFYIHESRQRAGLGKDLFTTMLQSENWKPNKLAIDRPSDKLLGFLRKHYFLEKTIPQMNNFVIYEGFFDQTGGNTNNNNFQQVHITSSPNTALFGPIRTSDDKTRIVRAEQQASYFSPKIHNAPIGRYAAARPVGSMAENVNHEGNNNALSSPRSTYSQNVYQDNDMYRPVIRGGALQRNGLDRRSGLQIDDRIDNIPRFVMPQAPLNIRRAGLESKRSMNYDSPNPIRAQVNHIPNGEIGNVNPSEPVQVQHQIINGSVRQSTGDANSTEDDQEFFNEEIESVRADFENLTSEPEPEIVHEPIVEPEPEPEIVEEEKQSNEVDNKNGHVAIQSPKDIDEPVNFHRFQRNKQHTGMKNMSCGVGAAVTPTNKMEFYQEKPEDFGIVKINQPACKSAYSQSDNVSVVSVLSGEGYTKQGHYDLKFHHNTLW